MTPIEQEKLENALLFAQIFEYSLDQGFQVASGAGPMCAEPMMGVCFVVEQLKATPYDTSKGVDPFGPMAGQLINAMREACYVTFSLRPRRLMEAFFRVELQCVTEVIGKMFGVISKRRGRITADGELIEGTSYYTVKALLPVQASFGFATDVRKKTGGVTNPMLVFSHWEVIPLDPFFVPTTGKRVQVWKQCRCVVAIFCLGV